MTASPEHIALSRQAAQEGAVLVHVVGTPEGGDHDGQGLLALGGDDQSGDEVVVKLKRAAFTFIMAILVMPTQVTALGFLRLCSRTPQR